MWQTDTFCVLRVPELREDAFDTEGLHALRLALQSSLHLCLAHLLRNAPQDLQLCVVEEAREDVAGLCYGAHELLQHAAVAHFLTPAQRARKPEQILHGERGDTESPAPIHPVEAAHARQ